jgi:RNA polymerase sigma-70 factor (ECF subfamily)
MLDEQSRLALARGGDEDAFAELVAAHRRELRAYCYRMAGSLDVADDLLQQGLLRAWRALPGFEGRSSFRTWLYRVVFSACIDALESKPLRRLTIDHGEPADPLAPLPPPEPHAFIGPCSAALYETAEATPDARYDARESVALAFLAALQLLPPRQRATLIARDVVGMSAEECADLFGLSIAAANSALQRARETIEARSERWRPAPPIDASVRTLLARYVSAWENADVTEFVKLLKEDATLAMPPLPLWLRGAHAIAASVRAMVLRPEARGLFRLIETEANGLPAFAAYRKTDHGGYEPVALHVIETRDSAIAAMTAFLDPTLFARLELPGVGQAR